MQIFRTPHPISFLTLILLVYLPAVYGATHMNGLASYNRFGQEQFVVAVYSDLVNADQATLLSSNTSKALELRIVDDRIFPRRFQRMWIEGLAINCSDKELEKHASTMADFSNMLNVQLRAGDIFRVERRTPETVTIFLNGTELGSVGDGSFFDLLLRSWVGPVPLSADLKESLQADHDSYKGLRDRFISISPSPARVEAVAAAIEARDQPSPETPAPAPKVASAPAVAPVARSAADVGTDTAAVTDTNEETETGPETAQSRETTPPTAVASNSPSADTSTTVTAPSPDAGPVAILDEGTIVLPASAETAVSAASVLLEQRYISQLTRWTQRFAKYPKRALRRNQEGTVQVTVTLDRNGAVKDVQLAEASRYDWLNEAAKEAVESANPFPPMPADLRDDEFQFTVPVVFKLF